MRRLADTLLCAAALVASDAAAQLRPERLTGSAIPVKPRVVASDQAAVVRQGLAQCMFKANPRAATALLANSDPVKVDLSRAGIKNLSKEFRMETCLGEEMGTDQSAIGLRMPLPTMRSLLLEQAYLAAQRQTPRLPDGAIETTGRPFFAEGDDLTRAQGAAAFSDCVSFRNAAGADALLRTPHGSVAESAAARALAPTLGDCLVEGQKLTLNVRSIRAFAADGLWHRFVRAAK